MPHPSLSLGKLKTGKNQQRHRKPRGASTEVSSIKLGYLFKSTRHHRLKGKVAIEQQTTSARSPDPESDMSLSPPSRQPPYERITDHSSLPPGIDETHIFSESASRSSTAEQSIASSEEESHSAFRMHPSKITSALLPKTPVDPFSDSSGASSAVISSPSLFDLRSRSAGDYIVRQLGATLEKLSLGESQYAKLEEDILPIRSLNTRCTMPKTISMSGFQASPTSSDMVISPAPHYPPKFKDSLASGYLANLKQQLQEKRWLCKFARSTTAKAHVAVPPAIFITTVDVNYPRPMRSPVGLFGSVSHSKDLLDDPALQPPPPVNSPCPDDPFNADPFAYNHPSQYDLPLLPSMPTPEETGEVTDSAWYLDGTPSRGYLELFPAGDSEDFAAALSATITNPFDLPPFSIPLMQPGLLDASLYDT
ncbi:hypothetical protein DEU56DRAFT_775041 [Suillus clintonianus]|uniref:uncharacterized protein n=1 Tax=Suillus clintonianus TaxID=1904413 RepID=UPI001B86465F|nr:uncharacterized protein DEU56DRAFT_775041 [Suillus clintonianus]KAG2153370.1 hypothetical protein DEU56DRAFT_775041 [Suillus clintonianus]